MTTGVIHDQKHIEKQMGCMAGFFQLFDRQHILTGKRICAAKRLPPSSPSSDSSSNSGKSDEPPTEAEKTDQNEVMSSPEFAAPAKTPTRMSLPLPIMESKDGSSKSSWKFSPRLSLDSRATVGPNGSLYPKEIRTDSSFLSPNRSVKSGDGDDKRRSPSVIARLMGLDPIPDSTPPHQTKIGELRRSASESRVSRDLFQGRLVDGNNSLQKPPIHSLPHPIGDNVKQNYRTREFNSKARPSDPMVPEPPKPTYKGGAIASPPWKAHHQRKSSFDAEDFFPCPKQAMSIYGDIEKKLRIRGIDEQSKDLESLKQILEALQLKGLLHSRKLPERMSQRNVVYDSYESPIVVMRPSRSPVPASNRRLRTDSPPTGPRRNLNTAGERFSGSPQRDRPEIERNVRNQARTRNSSSPTRRDVNTKSPTTSPARRRPSTIETQRKTNEQTEQRRGSSPQLSPKLSPKKIGTRSRKPTAEIDPRDESSSISESSVSTSSQTDTDPRWKREEYKEGRTLLDRCDKLLSSIMEITATELQPSPVSVLDSSFYKDDSSTPSPVMTRLIDVKDQSGESEEDMWSSVSPMETKYEVDKIEDADFVYISDILRASIYLPEDSNLFILLEKQQYLQGKDTSKVSMLQRKLTFDSITEILHRMEQMPSWKIETRYDSGGLMSLLPLLWSEYQKIRERDDSEADLFDVICGFLRKDLAGDDINGWGDRHVEVSEAVLDIERLIFKDLIGETIQDLAVLPDQKNVFHLPRRKLIF